jgi:urocanate hydratase
MDKGARKTNWSLAHKPEFYMQMLKAACKIAEAFRLLPREIGTVVLGRDHHHDVSGTDSPYRKHLYYDGSRFTADMAIQNVIGDSFRGATGFYP